MLIIKTTATLIMSCGAPLATADTLFSANVGQSLGSSTCSFLMACMTNLGAQAPHGHHPS